MEITGRVTADAAVRTVGEKEVLSFRIAINDRYKIAGSNEFKEVATFINCSYWIAVKVGQWIKKGAVVSLSGRLGMHVYINNDGNPIGSIDFHVNSINIIAFAKRNYDGDVAAAEGSDSKVKKDSSRSTVKSGKGKSSDEVPF